MAGGHVFRRSAFLVLLCVLFQIFKLCSSEIPSITALDMHKIKASKLNAAYFFWGSRGSASLRLFRVKSGLRLVQSSLLTIILIRMAGDVSRNPGPMDISAAEMNYACCGNRKLHKYSSSYFKPS